MRFGLIFLKEAAHSPSQVCIFYCPSRNRLGFGKSDGEEECTFTKGKKFPLPRRDEILFRLPPWTDLSCRLGLAPQTRGVGADGKALRRFSFGCISRSLLSTSGNITQTQNTLLFSKTIKSRKPTNILCTEKLTLRRSPEEGGHLSGLSLQLFFNQ